MISRIMDWLDRKVNPEAYDPHSIKNNRYNQWGSPAEEPTMPVVFNQTSAANQASTLYQQALGQQNYQNYTVGIGTLGTGVGSSILVSGTGINNINTVATTWIPSRMGVHFTMLFVDAVGNHHSLVVDQAHMGILQQIAGPSSFGGDMAVDYAPTTPAQKMLEGDFSFDEMEQAENIIAGLAGDKATKGHEASQDTEYASEGI